MHLVLYCPLQIAERKKLVSSINSDSILELEGNSISYERGDEPLSNKSGLQNATINGGNEAENQNGGIFLSKHVSSSINSDNIQESEGNIVSFERSDKFPSNKSNPQNTSISRGNATRNQNGGIVLSKHVQYSSKEEIPESVAINRGFDEAEEDAVKIPPTEMATSRLYFDEQLKSNQYRTIRPDTLPAFLANGIETSSLKVENQEGMSESILKEVTHESSNIGSEGEESLPLAGPNVMNVILVAAECAPWSKTGN